MIRKNRRVMAVRKRGTYRRRFYAISMASPYWDERLALLFAGLMIFVLAAISVLADKLSNFAH